MNICSYLLGIGIAGVPFIALGAENELSLIIHGASIHSGCDNVKGVDGKRCVFNGVNPGVGVDWAFLGDNDSGKLSLRGGMYRDSYEETATYAGFSYRKEWFVTDHAYMGLGLHAGYLDGSGIDGFAGLPIVILGYKSLALEIGYAPKMQYVIGESKVAVTTFSLRWTF